MKTFTAPSQWASTTGLNLTTPSAKVKEVTGRTFKTRGKGVERNGEPRFNEFEILALVPVKSNRNFTTVVAKSPAGLAVQFPILHNQRYLVPANQR